MKTLQRIELLKDFVQEAVDRGATSVEQVHQFIGALPFEALEKAGLLKEDHLQLRDKQRRAVGLVYEAIRNINRQIGELISDQIENLENAQQVREVLNEKAQTKEHG